MVRTLVPAVIALFATVLTGQEPLPNHFQVNSPTPLTAGGFGGHVQAVGDLDQDGFEDYAVSAPSFDFGSGPFGRIYVYSGRSSVLIRTFDGAQASTRLGAAMAALGDVDGDGVLDVAVGAPDWDDPVVGNNVGRVICFSGLTGAEIWSVTGDQINSNLGESLGVLGSGSPLNATTVVVGQPGYSSATLSNSGRVLYLTPTNGVLQSTEDGIFGFDGMGKTLAARGSFPALYAGSVGGRVHELSGPGSVLPPTEIVPPVPGSNEAPQLAILLGTTSGASGLAIGRRLFDTGGSLINNGDLRFLSLNALIPTPLVIGNTTNQQVGLRVIAVRDMDGDGNEEIGFASGPPSGFADIRFRVVTTGGIIREDYLSTGAASAHFSSILDVSGDGRGEILQATASGLSQRFDARLIAQGLAPSGFNVLGNGALHYIHDLDLGPTNAGKTYLQLYSATNYAPGFVYAPGAPIVPIFPDALTDLVISLVGSVLYPDAVGFLDGAGIGQTNAFVEPIVAVMFSGASFWTAVCILDIPGDTITATSNPVVVTLP